MKINNAMTLEQAKLINSRLIAAFMALEEGYPASTDLTDITLSDAITATDLMRAYPGDMHPDGSMTCYSVLGDSCFSKLTRHLAPIAA